jgi:NADH-quinone oxidoreductase subunit E
MSDAAAHSETQQPATFEFSSENRDRIAKVLARYPSGKQASAVLPLLDLAQRQSSGWLPRAAMDHVAGLLGMAPIRVYEVATFYSMFNLAPVGRHVVRVCTTTPCQLRGANDVARACHDALGVGYGETSKDGVFTLQEVECLGACVNAPVVWIDDDYYEDLDAQSMRRILDAMRRGEKVPAGSQSGRHKSVPAGGLTTLKDQAGA